MLFTGDAEKFVEDALFQNFNAELKSTVLKAGHHGSNGSVRIESDGKNNIVLVEYEADWVVDYTNQIVTVTRLD